VVVADFNGDGYLDVFLPHYSMISPDDHSCLLLNDGEGHFTDGSDLTGFASEPDANVAPDGIPHFLDTGPRMYPSNCDPVTRAYYLRTITTPAPTGLCCDSPVPLTRRRCNLAGM
jgi:hypothetical protein